MKILFIKSYECPDCDNFNDLNKHYDGFDFDNPFVIDIEKV